MIHFHPVLSKPAALNVNRDYTSEYDEPFILEESVWVKKRLYFIYLFEFIPCGFCKE